MPVTIRSSLLLLVLAVMLPGVLGGIWYVSATFEAERQAHERTLSDTARALSLVIDGQLAERAAIARVLSMSRWLQGAPALQRDDLEGFERLARRSLEGLDGWIELRTRESVVFDSRQPPGTPPTPFATGPVELATEPGVLPLRATGSPDEAYAAVVQPVRSNGSTVMNLLVSIRPVELQRIIDAQNLPKGWIGAVLDNSAMVVARHPDGPSFLGRQATQDLRAHMAQAQQGLFEAVSLEGRASTGYFSTSRQGWTYVSAMPREQFAGLPSRHLLQTAAGTVLLLMLGVVVALWLSRRIEGPVHALKLAAARLQRGATVPAAATATGIVECDEVAQALAEAAAVVQRSRIELEGQVADAISRTRQAEQKASQSQRVEALGRLTGGVAHDFNNLLGVISNSAHLMQRHPAAQELEVPLSATLRAVEAGSQLTQHLLRFAGRRPVRPQALQLERWLPELQDLLRSVLGRRIDLVVRVAEGLSPVRVDANELELALVNLALNARDAMPGGGELRITARHADAQESEGLVVAPGVRYVQIAVTDDGPGIAPEVLPRVFEPFFTTREVGAGTGLGLSQVHGFCQQAGGAARIASTQGLGTTVSLLLPSHLPQPDSAANPAPAASQGSVAGARVLLVDDNPTLRDITAALLRAHGAQVEHAGNSVDALQQLATGEPFDVVLSDVVMPGRMDGVALARLLRQQRPRLPVVLISGFSNSDAEGEFVMLRKPCPQDELLAALAQAIGSRPQGDATGATGATSAV